MITVTHSAVNQIKKMMTSRSNIPHGIKLGINTKGCSGLSYDLTFDHTQRDNDTIFEDNEVKIIVDKKSFLYLVGTTLEYSGGLNGKGFVFINPNADRTCGCGESFSI